MKMEEVTTTSTTSTNKENVTPSQSNGGLPQESVDGASDFLKPATKTKSDLKPIKSENVDLANMDVESALIFLDTVVNQLWQEQVERDHEDRRQLLLDTKREVLELLDQESAASNTLCETYDVFFRFSKGPFKGKTTVLHIDTEQHNVCLIGRSTGKKFRKPYGLSLQRDNQVSTTHAELRMDRDCCVYFTDLDSTNGSQMNGRDVESRERQLVPLDQTTVLAIGKSEIELYFEPRPTRRHESFK